MAKRALKSRMTERRRETREKRRRETTAVTASKEGLVPSELKEGLSPLSSWVAGTAAYYLTGEMFWSPTVTSMAVAGTSALLAFRYRS